MNQCLRHLGLTIIATFSLFAGFAHALDCAARELNCVLSTYENDQYGDLQSVVVIRNGGWLAERYYNGANASTLVDVRSAGKSVTSLLLGIAHDQGYINSLSDTVETYWPEAAGTALGPVPLDAILTMRSGLDADANDPTSPGYEDFMDESDDPLAVALAVPRRDAPDTTYRYNSHAAYIAGIVVGHAAGMGIEAFAVERLFGPLGINRYDWQEDRSGITKGQGNLFLTARGFARIGAMVLNDGKFAGQQVVSEAWIRESLTPRVDISADTSNASHYGYYWYKHTIDVGGQPVDYWFASGNGGNKIYLIPEQKMMVSVMSTAYGQGRGHRRSAAIFKDILATQVER